MSKLLCIIDGMTDESFRAAEYPVISSMRLSRMIETTPPGHETESLPCILNLLGVKNIPLHLRGYAEALGAGVAVGKDDLILRGSWFSVDSRGRCTGPAEAPFGAEDDTRLCRYYPLGGYQCLTVFPGMADCIGRLKTSPPFLCAGQTGEKLCPRGSDAVAEQFLRFCREDRCLVFWGQSVPTQVPPFPVKAAVVCSANIVRGIARLLGMELILPPGATGGADTDLAAKTSAALKAAEEFPFVLLHINGADEAAHRQDAARKRAFLQRVDAQVLPALLRSGHKLTVVSDHATEPENGLHTGGVQPVFSNGAGDFLDSL